MTFASIITGIGMNCVNVDLKTLFFALKFEEERLQDRKQMNILSAA